MSKMCLNVVASVEMSDSKAERTVLLVWNLLDTFCYLGDMLNAGGGVEVAVLLSGEMCLGQVQ